MKILLYEPGKTGHRPVILRLIQKVLDASGIQHHAIVEEFNSENLLQQLQSVARSEGCDLIHILTLDGLSRSLILSRLKASLLRKRSYPQIPVIATYYLFQNLSGFPRGFVNRMLLSFVGIRRVLSPDVRLEQNCDSDRFVRYLPDPVDEQGFKICSRSEAAAVLNVKAPHDSVNFLVFGELSERKGLSEIVRAFVELAHDCDSIHLLLAGQLSPSLPGDVISAIRELEAAGHCTATNRRVPEDDVARWYSLADYYLSNYPLWFRVSSGTVSRACVAGIPTIAGSHGQTGRLIQQNNCGIVFDRRSSNGLANAMRSAIACKHTGAYDEWRRACAILGERHTLELFGSTLIKEYTHLI